MPGFCQFQNFTNLLVFTVDLRNTVIILVTLTSFTKAANYWSDPGKCESLQQSSGIPEFLKNGEGIWKQDHGKQTIYLVCCRENILRN